MNKRDFYLAAINAETFLITAWNISCFSIIGEGADDWKKNPYPYRLVQRGNGYYYVNPEDTTELVKIEDAPAGQPLLKRLGGITIDAGELPNVSKPIHTTYSNVLANALMLIRPFKNKIEFMTGRFGAKKIEAMLEKRLTERPANWDGKPEEVEGDPLTAPIYIDEYLKYCDGAFSLVAYTQLFTPANTRKTMTAPPGIVEARNALVKQYAGRLHDRAVVAEISAKLREIDAAYLAGDRGEDFLISKKAREIVRPRKYLMYGAETGIEEKVDVDLIERSLTEGWDVNKFPSMNNALRAGSFNRGKQTELGGAAVKDLFRASGNLKISSEDCGSTVGLPTVIGNKDNERFVGFSVVNEDGSHTKITDENVANWVGKRIKLRSPMTCKNQVTDYCSVCLGDRLANNPTSLSMAVADYGSAFLAIYMSAAHSKGIQVARLDVKRQMR